MAGEMLEEGRQVCRDFITAQQLLVHVVERVRDLNEAQPGWLHLPPANWLMLGEAMGILHEAAMAIRAQAALDMAIFEPPFRHLRPLTTSDNGKKD